MGKKTDEQILTEVEVHTSNAVELLKKSQEISRTALDLDDIDNYIAAMKRAIALQNLSMEEMQKAVDLQQVFAQRLTSLQTLRSKFGLF